MEKDPHRATGVGGLFGREGFLTVQHFDFFLMDEEKAGACVQRSRVNVVVIGLVRGGMVIDRRDGQHVIRANKGIVSFDSAGVFLNRIVEFCLCIGD